MSDQYLNSKDFQGASCGKVAGIGCLSIVGLLVIGFLSSFAGMLGGSGIFSGLMFLAVIGVIIFLIIRSSNRASSKPPFSQDQALSAASGGSSAYANAHSYVQSGASTARSTQGEFESPVCMHAFSKDEIEAGGKLSCPCGYQYTVADIKTYHANELKIDGLQKAQQTIRDRILGSRQASSAESTAASASSAATYSAPKPAAIKRVTRPKRSLSTQQWLVIGASVLIFVAGMIFVSSNINRLPQWAFELVTLGLAVAMGFGSIYMRKISSLLASFFATFSAAMQLATLAIIGDQLNPSFEWNTMPAWWWLVSLVVITASSGVLAKFTKIFGWKAISFLSASASFLVLQLGILIDTFTPVSAPAHLAVATISSAATLWFGKYLRSIPPIEEKDKELKAYAKELATREDTSMRYFGLGAAALQAIAAIGVFLIDYLPSTFEPLDPVALIALAGTWFAIALTFQRWSGQLSLDGSAVEELGVVARFFIHISLTLAAVSAGVSIDAGMASVAIVVALVALVNLASGLVEPLKPTAHLTLSAVGAAALAGLVWFAPDFTARDSRELVAALIFGLAITLCASELRYRVVAFDMVTGISLPLSVVWYVIEIASRNGNPFSWLHALAVLGLLLLANIAIPVRNFINKRLGGDSSPALVWLAFGATVIASLSQFGHFIENGAATPVSKLLPLMVAFAFYALLALVVNLRTKFGSNNSGLTLAHSYFGQFAVLAACLTAAGANESGQYVAMSWLVVGLAAINYLHGWLGKRQFSLHVGFGLAILSTLPIQQANSGLDLVVISISAIAVITLLGLGHEWTSRAVGSASAFGATASSLGGVIAGLLFWLGAQSGDLRAASIPEQLQIQSVLWAIALLLSGMSLWSKFNNKDERTYAWWLPLVYVTFAASISFTSFGQGRDLVRMQNLLSALLIGLVVLISNRSKPAVWLIPFAYLGNLVAAWCAGDFTAEQLDSGLAPEPYSIWMAAAVVATTLATGKVLGSFKARLLLEIPVIGLALTSWIYSISLYESDTNDVLLRGIFSLAVLAVLAYFKSGREFPGAWITVGYLTGAGSSFYLSRGVEVWTNWTFDGPEPYVPLLAISVAVGSYFVTKRLGNQFAEFRTILMLAVLTVPSLVYSLTGGGDLVETRTRQALALAAIAGVALWRVAKKAPIGWAIASYLASIGAGLAAADLVSKKLLPDFEGPEIYSLIILLAVIVNHRICLPRFELKSSWISWGIPASIALLPSAFATASAASLAFEDQTGLQIARAVVVLVVSIALLVFGVRKGNLANTGVGLAGVALILVPNTAFQSERVAAGSQVESTAVVIALLLFVALSVLKARGILKGKSVLFIGLPIAIAMAPALVRALLALGNPTLTSVDWWRFAILMVAGLALLIVGALREVGGMFFPGLASVLLTSLPYAFMQSKDQEWFLWVVLLLVAAAMVWIALRLEKLRKAGRNSVNWLRELK